MFKRLVENLDRIALDLGLDLFEGAVNDAFGDRLLALVHEVVHELGNDEIAEFRIRVDDAFFCAMAT